MDDMGRFRERVLDLQRHFGQANDDIDKILTSSERIASRGQQDRELGFRGGGARADRVTEWRQLPAAPPSPAPAAERGAGGGTAGSRQPDLLAED